MTNVEVTDNANNKATMYQVKAKLDKAVRFLQADLRYPSLEYRKLREVKGIWKFKVGDHYWGLTRRDPVKLNSLIVYDVVKHP